MRSEEIDLALARGGDAVPSSGFTASVMDAITREAIAPPPIKFPWKRALPGLGWCLAAGIAFLSMGRGAGNNAAPGYEALDPAAVLDGTAWVSAALLVSLFSVALSMRVSRRV